MTEVHPLFFVVESPFSQRDWQRYGVDELSRRFDIKIIDVSPISQPRLRELRSQTSVSEPRVFVIDKLSELVAMLNSSSAGVLISNVGVGEVRNKLFRTARSLGFLIAEFELGAMPDASAVPANLYERLSQRLRQFPSALQIPVALLKSFKRHGARTEIPDVFYRGGRRARGRHPDLGSSVVDVHSFDYEQGRLVHRHNADARPRRLVYLDQNLGFHSDMRGLGLRQPVSADDFYPLINGFFDWLEREHQFEVVICPHPRAEMREIERRFPGKEVSPRSTAIEVAGSSAVCGHVSTSFSFAAIFKKPVVILTTREMSSSWYRPYLDLFADEFHSPILNLSDRASWQVPPSGLRPYQSEAYSTYALNYLKSYDGEEMSLWNIIGNDILRRISA